MARIVETVDIGCSRAKAWAAVGDIGGLDQSVPQLVAACEYDAQSKVRTVTFRNELTLVEPIIVHDEEAMLIAWTAQGGGWDHHNASLQVLAGSDEAASCRVQWIADVLPDSEEETIRTIVQAGLGALKETLEGTKQH
ncbi:MAG: SRPBCC family protein [Pseudomonadota bacterium]